MHALELPCGMFELPLRPRLTLPRLGTLDALGETSIKPEFNLAKTGRPFRTPLHSLPPLRQGCELQSRPSASDRRRRCPQCAMGLTTLGPFCYDVRTEGWGVGGLKALNF